MADSSLLERTYGPMPPGAIEPRGWLRRQLDFQADGITGELDEFWPPLADNQWLGGENDGWERGPYYADGLVPLAHLLDDDDLRAKAETWIEGFLDWHDEAGWTNPREPSGNDAHSVWPRAIILKVFRQHYAATGDERVIEAGLGICEQLHESELEAYPLDGWGRFRWQDLAQGVHWLHDETGKEWLLDLASAVAEGGYNWRSHFAGDRRTYGFVRDEPPDGGGPQYPRRQQCNGGQGPAVAYRQTGKETDRAAVANAIDMLETYHGQATGVFTGDEHLAGRDPTRGTELCAVVEYMSSLEELVSTLGEVRFADRLERIAHNALPAQFTPDMWAHQYDQQANQVLCGVGEFPWSNSPDANCFGLKPRYAYCTANLHQGWPKFASHCWMERERGPLAIAYAPSSVSTKVDGVDVRLIEETDYPFGDDVRFTVESEAAVEFTLDLRIPGWAVNATIELPNGETLSPESGTFHAIDRKWHDGAEVRLSVSPHVEADRRYQGSVTLSRGPLVFSLPIVSEARYFPGEDGETPYAHREYHPTEPWNFGLAVDTDDPANSLSHSPPGEVPFTTESPPVELVVEGARVENWTLEASRAGDMPRSPTIGDEMEELTLVPYGCTTLRVTEFPLLNGR